MKRVAIYAHYDGHDVVKRYVEYQLRRLREVCDEIVFVSTAALPETELAKVRPYCARATLRENVGYDFAMWQQELLHRSLDDVDELVLTNSSVFGPLFLLGDAFARMAPVACDFWGMTDSPTPLWHLQSYFLVFRRAALGHPCFGQFWQSLFPYRTKRQLIYSYELGLSTFLVEHGLRAAAFAPYAEVAAVAPRFPWSRRRAPASSIRRSSSRSRSSSTGCRSSRSRSFATTSARCRCRHCAGRSRPSATTCRYSSTIRADARASAPLPATARASDGDT